MRFSWIQAEWEPLYIRDAKDTILTLVRLHFQLIHHLMTCRCASTVAGNRQGLKL